MPGPIPTRWLYVHNNPIRFADAFGLKPNEPWISEADFCGFLGRAGSFAAGFGDALTGGLTDKARDWTGANDAVDKHGGSYSGGGYGAWAWAAASGGAIAWELGVVGAGGLAAQGLASEQVANITFARGVRHLAGTGSSQEAVESAITADIQQILSSASSTGEFWGRVTIGGITITYRAFTLANGTISVGTYTIPRP